MSSGCPVKGHWNPENNLPASDQLQSDAPENLSGDRETSSIPRTDESSSSKWIYPSPKMFYNALKRKGKETDPSDIPVMVEVHNFLNEQVWHQIEHWESLHAPKCPAGPTLKRFLGRPDDLSPKAWFYHRVYGGQRPFDRHDWTVDRCGKEVRYVIDYYGGTAEEGQGVFHVDVRPALDSPFALIDRIRMAYHQWTNNK